VRGKREKKRKTEKMPKEKKYYFVKNHLTTQKK